MNNLIELDDKLSKLLVDLPQQKATRNNYLSHIRDILDMYLFSMMDEEDQLYSLLHQRSDKLPSHNYKSMKIISPFCLQMNIILNLPFPSHEIQVEEGNPGFVKLKLPANIQETLTHSKIWMDACNRGVQKSLLRHITAWTDEENYLLQTAFLKWFAGVVDSNLALTGKIPNYKIKRDESINKVSLMIEDMEKGLLFSVNLVPVIAFPVSQLPGRAFNVPQDSCCSEWMVECRSNEVCSQYLWGVALWQHERELNRRNLNLKPMIQILKSLRDGCKWHGLVNYHLRSIVMLSYQESPTMFDELTNGAILSNLLFDLRNRLVCKEGIPFVWNKNYNILSGLTGLQKAQLARSLTIIRDELRTFTESSEQLFRLQTYVPMVRGENSTDNDTLDHTQGLSSTPSPSGSRSNSQSEASTVTLGEDDRLPPRAQLRPDRNQSGTQQASQMAMQQGNSTHWWALGGAAAVAGIALITALSQRNRNK